MNIFQSIYSNDAFRAAFWGWFWAQTLKGIFIVTAHRKFSFKHFIGTGGMPSSHSAFVTALTVAVGQLRGWDSVEVAICLVFSFVVMYDAAGLRRAAGKQAEVLNKMVEDFYADGRIHEQRLRELLGHTPKEVFAGAALGAVIALWVLR